jgi:hypothetical protein
VDCRAGGDAGKNTGNFYPSPRISIQKKSQCSDTAGTRQAMCVQCNIQARSRNHFCRRKAISITYSECVSVALVIQHAKRMRHIILSSVACLALPYFFTLSHNGTIFGKKYLLKIKHVLIFSTNFSKTFLILRRTE